MFKKSKTPPVKYNIHRTFSSGAGAQNHFSRNLDNEAKLDSGNTKKRRWYKFKRAYLILVLVLLSPILVIAAWDLRNFSDAGSKLFGSGNPLGVLATKPLEDTDKRVNILLIGYSIDNPGHGGAKLTDSIMILSLDKDTQTGYMLSIPRDLYVDIPDYGSAKINEAFQAGERAEFDEKGYPKGGVGLLQKAIYQNLGIESQYYLLVDYAAVRDIVNALGGIDVLIDSPDKRGIYDPNFQPNEGGPLKLTNGAHHIDGQTALRLTRARGSTFGSYGFPQSDFNRTSNQQAVLNAIKNELDWKLILDPRTNGRIFDAAASNIETDLQLSEVLPFYRLFNSVPDDKLKPTGLNQINGKNLLTGYRAPNGGAALVPSAGITDFSQIKSAIRALNQ